MQKNKKNAAIGFIFITLLIDIIGWGIIIPVIPKLLEEMLHVDASGAATYGGWLTFAYALTQFVFAPVVGNLSDKFGRRPVILLSLVGFSLDYVFLYFAPTFAWLMVGRVLAGITGASVTTASAYIADISTEKDRAKNFGLIGAAFGLGFIIGPLLGGLLGSLGPKVPFMAAAILCLINFLYGFFILPESLRPELRRPFDWKRANPIGSLLSLKKYPELLWLIISLTLVYVGSHAVQSNWSYFTMFRFGWTEKTIGISLGVMGVLVGLVQGVLIRWINPKLGNEKSIYMGLGLYTIGMFLFAWATQSWMMYAFLIPYCLGGIAGPALQSVITSKVPANEQGELQGALTSLMSATSIIGPPLMTNTFYFFTHKKAPVYFPGASFVLGGLLMGLSALLAYYTFTRGRLFHYNRQLAKREEDKKNSSTTV
ncbi:TCR/Tet family MFS transporter [Edaphocola aurantiacus]|uniref:TCR/Tet family MFS transporter n=1 Tax=Edaphocola aurantiacus TaxID=2601682 RepID=UPI001C947057|nr:TCR/Tet family MFS transporter [Edaphocola aurantiacus]